MISPARTWNGRSGKPSGSAQHEPSITVWKVMTCPAPAITRSRIACTGGLSAAKGDRASMSKNTAPVSRTASNTSESTSMSPPLWTIDQFAWTNKQVVRISCTFGQKIWMAKHI
jgi:hypothetical protein